MNATSVTRWAAAHSPWSYLGAVLVLLVVLLAVQHCVKAARRAGRGRGITVLINVAALLATSVQASGMWKFFGTVMGLPVGFRIVLFGFMEIALLACGLRARDNVEKGEDAGVDWFLVVALALASGVMASTDAASGQEALMRLVVSVVVAGLWTRDLMAAKRAARTPGARHSSRVRWRITPERILVALRLADATDMDVSTVDAGRRVARFLRKTDRERRGRRWPFTAKAIADRERLRMFRDALMRYGDPTEVYGTLAQTAYSEAMSRLGIAQMEAETGAKLSEPSESAALALTVAVQETAINTPVNTPPLTGIKPLSNDDVELERISTGRAEEIMRFGWESGMGVRETARVADRDPAQVSRRFARLDEEFGPRPRSADTGAVALVNGSS